MTNLFTQLDAGWARRASSPAALDILARRADSEPTLSCFSTIHGATERLPAVALFRPGDEDEDARLAPMFVLRPGLSRVSGTYVRRWVMRTPC